MNLQPVRRPDADIPHMLPFGEDFTKVLQLFLFMPRSSQSTSLYACMCETLLRPADQQLAHDTRHPT